jgi:hypothetical protein
VERLLLCYWDFHNQENWEQFYTTSMFPITLLPQEKKRSG